MHRVRRGALGESQGWCECREDDVHFNISVPSRSRFAETTLRRIRPLRSTTSHERLIFL